MLGLPAQGILDLGIAAELHDSVRIEPQLRNERAQDRQIGDVPALGKLGFENAPREWPDPTLLRADERHPGGLQPVGWKHGRHAKCHTPIRRNARQVANHVAALGREDLERQCVPTLGLEDGTEQKRTPDNLGVARCQSLYPHGG